MAKPEIWKNIPDYPGYLASNLGNVWGPRGQRTLRPDKDGYIRVNLWQGGECDRIGLHRVICMTFHADTYFPGAHALHKNHIPTDCREDNLYWGTAKQNVADKYAAGRGTNPKGEDHRSSKLNWSKVREIRTRFKAGESQSNLAVEFGVSQTACSRVCLNKTWKES